jgi:4-amino-4-deoxy-L-arabinose transferase-like glycosyltransferase
VATGLAPPARSNERAAAVAAAQSSARLRSSLSRRLGRIAWLHYGLCALAVAALMAFNVFWRLGDTAISSMDEARYGVAASEMLRAHHYLVPTYAGLTEYWNLKPPLGYWLLEGSYRLLGRSVLALRLPSALSALAVVLLTMAFCKGAFGRRAALLSGLFVATCFGFLSYHGARNGDLDAELTLLMTVALMLVPRLAGSPGARLAWGATLGLGFLLKSFAILPFALAAGVYLLSFHRDSCRWRAWLPAAAVFSVLVGGWAVLRTVHDGTPYFVKRMISEDLLMRATHSVDGGTSLPWSYLLGLFDRFAPWPVLLLFAWFSRGRAHASLRHRSSIRLLLLWALLPLTLFSLARTHHHWYLDPTYPAWAMLAALAVLELSRRVPWRAAFCCGMIGLVGCSEARVLGRIALRDQRPPLQVFLMSLHPQADCSRQSLVSRGPLAYSQRFILQVLDGFDVQEPGESAPSWRPGCHARVILARLTADSPPIVSIQGTGTAAPLVSGTRWAHRHSPVHYAQFAACPGQVGGRTIRRGELYAHRPQRCPYK